jgi:hypothetical protein
MALPCGEPGAHDPDKQENRIGDKKKIDDIGQTHAYYIKGISNFRHVLLKYGSL